MSDPGTLFAFCVLVYTYRSCEDFYPVLQFIFALSSLTRKLGEVAGEREKWEKAKGKGGCLRQSEALCTGVTFYDLTPGEEGLEAWR